MELIIFTLIKLVLLAVVLYFIYFETGGYTTAFLAFVGLHIELDTVTSVLTDKKGGG